LEDIRRGGSGVEGAEEQGGREGGREEGKKKSGRGSALLSPFANYVSKWQPWKKEEEEGGQTNEAVPPSTPPAVRPPFHFPRLSLPSFLPITMKREEGGREGRRKLDTDVHIIPLPELEGRLGSKAKEGLSEVGSREGGMEGGREEGVVFDYSPKKSPLTRHFLAPSLPPSLPPSPGGRHRPSSRRREERAEAA